MASPTDSAVVGRHDEEHLRRFVGARDRGDEREMAHWWGELVIDFDARMDALVAGRHKGRLDRAEHEEAVQRSLIRFATKLVTTFRGRTMGELVNATKTLAFGICVDVQRESVAARRRETASLDALGEGDGAQSRAASGAAQGAGARDGERREARDAIGWALARLPERDRRVMEMTRDGVPVAEMMRELDVSRDNAYQLRTRATRKLRELLTEWDA